MSPSPLPNSCDLEVRRVLAAPRERAFAAWTTQLPAWWGPRGTTLPVCEMDLRPGGRFHTVIRAPDGAEYATRGVFLEVIAPERIVFTDAFEADWQPSPGIFFTAVTTFEAMPDDQTLCLTRALHWSPESRARHERMGFVPGWGESLDRLAELLRLHPLP